MFEGSLDEVQGVLPQLMLVGVTCIPEAGRVSPGTIIAGPRLLSHLYTGRARLHHDVGHGCRHPWMRNTDLRVVVYVIRSWPEFSK